MAGTLTLNYDPSLVLLSLVMAVFASYTALDIGSRIVAAEGLQQGLWLIGSAVALGGGIWSTQFIGMLATEFGIPVRFAFGGTLASLVLVMVLTALSLKWVCVRKLSAPSKGVAGLCVGTVIWMMHLLIVGAMEIDAEITRSWSAFSVSIAVSYFIAFASVWMVVGLSDTLHRVGAAVVLGGAICAMHYIGMASLSYQIVDSIAPVAPTGLSQEIVAVLVAFGTVLILALVLVSAILDRRLSEAEADALRMSEERFRIMAEALPISLAVTRVEDREVVYSNQRSVELFKVPADPAKREPASKRYVNPEDREKVAKAVAEHGFIESQETRMRKYGGTEFWALISARRTPTSDGDMIVSGYYDITDRKEAEEELVRKEEKLRQANQELQRAVSDLNRHSAELEEALKRAREADKATRAKSTFLATMSHEIRTPMNGILGLLELLSETELQTDQQNTVDTINGSAKAMLSLIDDILDFSKIEAGKLDIEHAEMNLVEVIESIGTVTIANAREKNLAVLVYIDPDLPVEVIGDEVRVRQILNNLVSNALKFTSEGEIRIHATPDRRVNSDLSIRFDVEDTGIGIAEDQREKLFEPFAQAEASTTRRYGGTGLGLAISQRLTHLLGGSIGVDSEPGKGSTFTVRLPFQVAASSAGVSKDRDRFSGRTAVMVTHSTRKPLLANKYLSWLGLQMETAKTIEDGLRILRKKSSEDPNVLILSSDAFGEDKETTLRNLIQRVGGKQIKVVAVVRNADEAQRLSQLGLDGVAIITQPVLRTAFMNAVTAVLTGESVAVAVSEEHAQDTAKPGKKSDADKQRVPDRATALNAGRLILVAEDHETNRMVIQRQLTRLGYTADLVCDGREAYEAFMETDYGLILTDCHMPELDGLELTKDIRSLDDPKKSTVPIVAITANAMSGEAERCIEIGMNDYLYKPVSLSQLRGALEKWLPDQDGGGAQDTATRKIASDEDGAAHPEPAAEDVDRSVLAELVGDDGDAIRELLQSFISNAHVSVQDLATASGGRNADDFERAAHKLSGSARTAGASGVNTAIEEMRSAAQKSNWDDVDNLIPSLELALKGVEDYVARM